WWFSDGAFVIRAAPEYRRTLGCRVVAINGHELSEACDRVATLFAGNDSWARYLSPLYLTSPTILHGLGWIRDGGSAVFTFESGAGRRFDLRIRSAPIDRSAKPSESWQELSPLYPTGWPRWVTALAARRDAVPLCLRHPDKPYWFEFQSDSGLLYFQYNRSDNAEVGPSFEQFGDSLLAFARRHDVRDVVVDLRFNSGGNLEVARSFMHSLAR